MPTPIVILAVFAYIFASAIAMKTLSTVVPYHAKATAALIFAAMFLCGWVWLWGSLALGSARDGFKMLRLWVGSMAGFLVAIAPFSLLPHPITLVVGVVGGFACATWIATGKALWLHKE